MANLLEKRERRDDDSIEVVLERFGAENVTIRERQCVGQQGANTSIDDDVFLT